MDLGVKRTFYGSQVLQFEQQYLDALPSAVMYEKSYMHRDVVTQVVVSNSRHREIAYSSAALVMYPVAARPGKRFMQQLCAWALCCPYSPFAAEVEHAPELCNLMVITSC
jgi:hypothetical protein